jgi:hypothetical protein
LSEAVGTIPPDQVDGLFQLPAAAEVMFAADEVLACHRINTVSNPVTAKKLLSGFLQIL